jgi:hypothetical protein
MNCPSSQYDQRASLCRLHPHPGNDTSISPPSTPKRLPLQSTTSNTTNGEHLQAWSDSNKLPAPDPWNPRAACRTDCTLEPQDKPLRLFRLLRSDCQCSHQRAAVRTQCVIQQPSQVLEVQEESAVTDCHSHTSKPLRRKKSTKPKLFKGDARSRYRRVC